MQRVINILLVEDDRLDQMEVQRTLEKKGIVHRLKIALNGEEALAILDESRGNHNRPDLILVDLNMPKMNGFEFLEKVRSVDEYKDIKLFVLSTSDDKEDKMAAAKFGISGFITKPLKLESPPSLDAFNLMIDLMNMQIK
ncbi:response regulator [Chryseolinea sp. T2]|uniref:response regulator n=1 Tax=Chryseolinea sp. T2 TaxID=3129255 RepID=UPI0030773BFC